MSVPQTVAPLISSCRLNESNSLYLLEFRVLITRNFEILAIYYVVQEIWRRGKKPCGKGEPTRRLALRELLVLSISLRFTS